MKTGVTRLFGCWSRGRIGFDIVRYLFDSDSDSDPDPDF